MYRGLAVLRHISIYRYKNSIAGEKRDVSAQSFMRLLKSVGVKLLVLLVLNSNMCMYNVNHGVSFFFPVQDGG